LNDIIIGETLSGLYQAVHLPSKITGVSNIEHFLDNQKLHF